MTKRKYRFIGEEGAIGLVAWLNSAQSEGRGRVIEIMELYNRLGKSIPPMPARFPKPGSPGAMTLRLGILLDRYTYRLENRGPITGFSPAAIGRETGRDWRDEYHNVLRVHKLREMGLLSRVKRCDGCGKWLFAKLPGQRFCAESCRVKAYQSDPHWRDRNNAKRRKTYRQRKQNGNIRVQERRDAL